MIPKTTILFKTLVVLSAGFFSCDHGLQPDAPDQSGISGISGVITYRHWPAAENVQDLRLVVFKNYPPDNILTEVISGNAVVYPGLSDPGLPYKADSTSYSLSLAPGTYQYVVVAQQYGPSVTTDWQAAGHYHDPNSLSDPTPVTIKAGILLTDIDILVDFEDLPPQPF